MSKLGTEILKVRIEDGGRGQGVKIEERPIEVEIHIERCV